MGNRRKRHGRAGAKRRLRRASFKRFPRMITDVKAHQERQAMYDINELMIWTRKEGIKLLLIGGYAARAFSGPTRYTHDIDMVVHEGDAQRIGVVLKKLGYTRKKIKMSHEHTALKGIKRCTDPDSKNRFNVEVHISVGDIYDASSGNAYYPHLSFMELPEMEIQGFYEENRNFRMLARILKPEELLITKMSIQKVRDKDLIDAIAIVKYGLENPNCFSNNLFVELVRDAGLAEHIAKMTARNFVDGLSDRVEDAFIEVYERHLTWSERQAFCMFVNDVLPSLK